jgi:hypothetical protein
MGLAELAFRAGRAVQARTERIGFGLARPGEPSGHVGQPWCAALSRALDSQLYRGAADAVLSGRFDVFALRGTELGFPPRWNRDPKTGTEVPLQFGKAIDYRDERVAGDIKYLWEPNRHLELTTLAQAWHLTREPRYAQGCATLLESWFDACPYPMGINWTSSLEAALRLVNWHFTWHLLGGDTAPVFAGDKGRVLRERWLRSVFEHCHFIDGYLSRHSSANNHLLGEFMGLFVGAVGWPLWPQSAGWQRRAHQGFETEALRQNAPDGVNREQATYYQHEVADMMLLCGLVGRANGLAFGEGYWQRLQRLLDFIAAVMDVGGNVPMIGDADDAVMVRLSREPGFDVYRSLLATGAVLFDRPDFAGKAARFDDKSRWLLGDDAQAMFEALSGTAPPAESPVRTFPQGGYYVLGHRLGQPDEIRLVADAGPLGYLSIAAHGHADALAFTLSVAGQELLIDPGTFAYHTEKRWRDYFRGTRAHNTVCVDGQDQSVAGGNFLWLRHANAQCERFEVGDREDRFVGAHDGYRRLPDPVIHRREIVLDKVRQQVVVHDALECRAAHDVEVLWHLAEDCRVMVNDGVAMVGKGPVRLRIGVAGAPLSVESVQGRETPPLGWVSRRFDIKVPAPTLRWHGRLQGAARWTTTLSIELRHASRTDGVRCAAP